MDFNYTITYIMFLTTLANKTPNKCLFCSLVCCDKHEDNLKWTTSGLFIGL